MYVRQAANTLQILEYFAERQKPATAAEIAEDLGWHRSSTFKLIGTLVVKGFLYQPQARSGYYPSPRWLDLANRVANADPLPTELHRLAKDVARATGETTLIAAPAGVQAIFLDVQVSHHAVRYITSIGQYVPIHASSAGRALLAQMNTEQRNRVYRKISFENFSRTAPMTREMVEAEIAEAESRGFHQSNAEYTPDLAGVALPLSSEGRRLSIVVVGPISRCLDKRPEIAKIIKQYLANYLQRSR